MTGSWVLILVFQRLMSRCTECSLALFHPTLCLSPSFSHHHVPSLALGVRTSHHPCFVICSLLFCAQPTDKPGAKSLFVFSCPAFVSRLILGFVSSLLLGLPSHLVSLPPSPPSLSLSFTASIKSVSFSPSNKAKHGGTTREQWAGNEQWGLRGGVKGESAGGEEKEEGDVRQTRWGLLVTRG